MASKVETAAPDPWLEQARFLVRDGSLELTFAAVAHALALAYEQGYAQGRLFEIERERTTSPDATVREALIDGTEPVFSAELDTRTEES